MSSLRIRSLLRQKWILIARLRPFNTSANPRPVLTGRFAAQGRQTSGRTTIFKKSGGEMYLRLSDFATSNVPDVHVALTRSADPDLSQDVKGGLDSTP